ncbi:MAG: hypothetical protein JNM00_13075, partial [Flavobacteriales bacterium]|nr:hypothetical protein [Flavobacteriales bacterium]
MAKKPKQAGNLKRDLRKEVLEVFRKNPRKPLNHIQVSAHMGISDSGIRKLIYELLQDAVASDQLRETDPGKFVLKDLPTQLYSGIIDITRSGRGFVQVEGFDRDLEIPKGNTGLALYGDTVELQFNPKSRKPVARVVRVLQRARQRYVGIIEISKDHAFLLPSDQRSHADFFIPK